MHALCCVDLLGALRFSVGAAEVDRFRTKKVAELFAYLAFHRDRVCTREELANILWPDEYDDSARMNRLSNALSALRTQLEPPTVAKGSVLDANRYSARLRPETVQVDVLEFKQAIKACAKSTELKERIDYAERAFKLFRGDFAPTLDSDWIFAERVRLQDAFGLLLADLRDLWEQTGELAPAIDYASRLVATDEFSEAAHAELIRLYLRAGKNSAARDQLATLGKVLEELEVTPSPETLALFDSAPERPTNFRRTSIREEALAVASRSEPDDATTAWNTRPSLPFQTTRFFGREEEIALGVQVLGRPGARLITLIGPGGSGKTRLSIEIARAAAEPFQGCVYFAALADVTDPDHIEDVILAGIGVSRQSSHSASAQIATILESNESSLLVLDNVEQIIDEIGAVAEELLDLIPGLKIISTSRRNLNLTGETEVHVSPLPLPLPDVDLSPSEMIAFPSVALFVDRAQHVCADFQLTQRNAPAVADLCRKLDGMPLAIELAATWAKTLSPQQMLLQLQRRFDFLVTRRRDVPARHQKMLAIIESSYMQLDPALRKFFIRLSVFQGGWTLEAAAAVCEAPLAMAWLQELLERTLITSSPLETRDGCTMRFEMLETIKAFCETQLDPEDKEELLLAHATYLVEHVEREGQGLYAYNMKMPFQAFTADLPNYRLALTTTLNLSRWQEPSSILLHTYQGWEDLGLFLELLDWLKLIPTTDMDPRTKAFILRHRARCNSETGQSDAGMSLFEGCLRSFRELGETEGVAGTLANLGIAHIAHGDLIGAAHLIDDALALARTVDNKPLLARMIGIRGSLYGETGDLDLSRECYRECFQLSNQEGHMGASACNYLANIEIMEGNWQEATALSRAALGILERSPNLRHEQLAWLNLGKSEYALGSAELAKDCLRRSLEFGRRSQDSVSLVAIFKAMAQIANDSDDATSALVFVGAAKAHQRESAQAQAGTSEHNTADSEPSVEALLKKLGEVRSQQAIAMGQSMRTAEAIRFAEDFLKKSNKELFPQDI